MAKEVTITADQLRTLNLNTELGGNTRHLNHFSYAEKGTSAYSFGLLQFDVGNDDSTRRFLGANGFSADDIAQLSRRGGLTRQQLDAFDAKLQAIPQDKMDQFTNQRLEQNLQRVDDAIGKVRAANPAAADAIVRNPELQLAMADYDNQFGSMGKQFIGYLSGEEVKLQGGTIKAGNPPTRDDVQKFIESTKYGVENPRSVASRDERFEKAMTDLGISQSPGSRTQPTTPTQADPMADGKLQRGERGDDVRGLQQSLNELKYTDARNQSLETRSGIYGENTEAAVRKFQQANGLEPTGVADKATLEAIGNKVKFGKDVTVDDKGVTGPDAKVVPPTGQSQTTQQGEGTWPAPGNYSVNQADKPGEGKGGWNTSRPAHKDGDGHDGVDIQGKVGDPIKAFKGGTVVTAGFIKGYGNTIDIKHDDGSVTRYAHLDSINVKAGRTVDEGQVIGKMGKSGNVPKDGDAHLHFEYRVNGKDVDPMPHLNKAKRDDGTQPDKTAPSDKPEKPAQTDKSSRAMADGVLKLGDRGPEVKEYLEKLDKLGYRGPKGESLLADKPEIFGPAAKFATEKFQRAHGLEADGKAGKDTLPLVDKAQTKPLLSEANHPYHKLYAELGKQFPDARPEVVANATLKAVAGNITEPGKLSEVKQDLKDPEVKWLIGKTPGDLAQVNVTEPTAKMQDISDFLSKEARQAQEARTQVAAVEEDKKPAKTQA